MRLIEACLLTCLGRWCSAPYLSAWQLSEAQCWAKHLYIISDLLAQWRNIRGNSDIKAKNKEALTDIAMPMQSKDKRAFGWNRLPTFPDMKDNCLPLYKFSSFSYHGGCQDASKLLMVSSWGVARKIIVIIEAHQAWVPDLVSFLIGHTLVGNDPHPPKPPGGSACPVLNLVGCERNLEVLSLSVDYLPRHACCTSELRTLERGAAECYSQSQKASPHLLCTIIVGCKGSLLGHWTAFCLLAFDLLWSRAFLCRRERSWSATDNSAIAAQWKELGNSIHWRLAAYAMAHTSRMCQKRSRSCIAEQGIWLEYWGNCW